MPGESGPQADELHRLQEERARLAAIVESSNDAIIGRTLDGVVTSWNAGAERLYGYSAAEVIGHTLDEYVPAERAQEFSGARERIRRGEWVEPYESERITKDGRRLPVSVTVSPIRDPDGKITGISVVARDISERVRLQAELEQQARLLDLVHDAILVRGLDGVISYWNEGATLLYGWSADEARGEVSHMLLQAALPSLDRPLEEILLAEGSWQGEIVHTRRDGTEVAVDSRQVLVYDSAGQPSVIETNRDVTARKLAEASREFFLSTLTHDLRSPLSVIRGMTQLTRRDLLRSGAQPLPGLLDRLSNVDAAITQIDVMLRQVLDLARIQAGQSLELNLSATNLADLVRKVAAEQQRTTTQHEIRVEAPPEGIVGRWDADRLERVLANVLNNAVKYSPDGGRISVEIGVDAGSSASRWAWIAVHDPGIGIPRDDLPRVFDPFFRATNARAGARGFGLGLAGAKALIEQHGGSIELASAEGDGTTVTMRLPLDGPDTHGTPQ